MILVNKLDRFYIGRCNRQDKCSELVKLSFLELKLYSGDLNNCP